MESKPVNIFEYDNYRSFLDAVYKSMRSLDRKYSFRFFGKAAGFRSPNFMKLVIDGKRNIGSESIERFALALKLSRDETLFFRNLVMMNQASTTSEKQVFAEQLIRSKGYRKIHPLHESQFKYYSHWYYVAVRELVGLKTFKEDPHWIAQQISPPITPAEAKSALEELQKLGLIERTTTGELKQAQQNISTSDEVTSSSIASYHREMMQKASESIDRVSREKREISSVTVSVSPATAKKLKEVIQNVRKEILELVSRDEQPSQVYQLNFQLFPISKGPDEGQN